MERVLVVGATGQTGKRIIEILNSSSTFEPYAMIRKDDQRQMFEDMDVETVMGDLEKDVDQTSSRYGQGNLCCRFWRRHR